MSEFSITHWLIVLVLAWAVIRILMPLLLKQMVVFLRWLYREVTRA